FFFCQAEDGIRDWSVTGVQTCALPICARLFFTKAKNGGAGCFTCHSGPMFNKQPTDPDVTGVGQLVEENFFNVGIGDHPLQALRSEERRVGKEWRDWVATEHV